MAGIGAVGDLARVNTNIGAMNTYNHLREKNKNIQQGQERLATGKRVNRSSDSPANYVIAQKLKSKENALGQAQENIGDSVSALTEMDSSLTQMEDVILEMKNLAQQAASDTVGSEQRVAIEYELQQYAEELNDIAQDANWQGEQLLSGNLSWQIQVGEKSTDTINLELYSSKDVDGNTKGFSRADLELENLEATSNTKAAATWEKLNSAESVILESQEKLGAVINRLELKSDALSASEVNAQAARSRIEDSDIALEQMQLAQENILQQVSLVMLGQAQQAPGSFLTLFR